jgi:putative heme-binding domain-containing protein
MISRVLSSSRIEIAAALALGLAGSRLVADEGERAPWVSSRFHGSPDPPPPFRAELAFPRLKLTHPVVMTWAPGTERLFLVEQEGRVLTIPNDPDCDRPDVALDLAKRVEGCNIYGLAFHPRFEENRFAYLCYVLPGETPEGTRVSRFELTRSDPPRFDPGSERILITWLSGGHNGGCLEFGPDGFLYIATGDAAPPSPPDPLDTGQDLGDLLSSILRIDVDREERGRLYAVPGDNPFVDEPGARPEIWAYGLRNPWKIGFDRATGDLWAGDVGWEMWELVYRIERGGNYGWSVVEGRQPVHPAGRRGPTPILPPFKDHPHSEAASVTGGLVYRGSRLEELRGAYVYGDYVTGKIWALRQANGVMTSHREIASTPLHIVAFGEDRAGEMFILDHEPAGRVFRLVANAPAGAGGGFPTRLGETGLFESVKDGELAPGVLPFAVVAGAWADGADVERVLALPGRSRIDTSDPERWKFPDGTVLARTLSIRAPAGEPAGRLPARVETQVLHLDEGTWRPYAYAWNRDGTDATLVGADGASVKVGDRTWRIASRGECGICHNSWAGQVLGASAIELDRDAARAGGAPENQLRAWARRGMLSHALPERRGSAPRLASPHDSAASLEARARSYLHVNCSHCHRFGAGGTALIDVAITTELAKTQTLGAAPVQGTFGIPDARIIATGDPYRSVLYYRMAKLGGGHMPRAGPRDADEEGLELIEDWIASLPPAVASPPATGGSDQAPAALRLASRIGRGALGARERGEALAAARVGATIETRELFDRFLPEAERTSRLGPSFRPEEVLSLAGDVARGKRVFLESAAAQCKSCHTAEGAGEAVGPDLSHIGKKYTAEQILEHTTSPSREVAPEYAAYVLVTKSGLVATGLLVEKGAEHIVLKDAKAQLTRVAAAEVQSLDRQKQSLMPELLLQDLAPQAAADLIAYLVSLK